MTGFEPRTSGVLSDPLCQLSHNHWLSNKGDSRIVINDCRAFVRLTTDKIRPSKYLLHLLNFFTGEEFWIIADAWPKYPATAMLKKASDCVIKKKVDVVRCDV